MMKYWKKLMKYKHIRQDQLEKYKRSWQYFYIFLISSFWVGMALMHLPVTAFYRAVLLMIVTLHMGRHSSHVTAPM